MRAIIIDDKDAIALLERLDLTRLRENHYKGHTADWELVDKVHRVFHYVVCSWLQEQGAKLTR